MSAPSNEWDQPANRAERRALKKKQQSAASESESDASDGASPKKRRAAAQSAEDADPLANAGKIDTRHMPMFGAVAVVLTLAPAYLYANVFDLPFRDYPLNYLIAIGASVVALAYSYQIVYVSTNSILLSQRKEKLGNNKLQKELGYGEKELEKLSKAATSQEASYYSLIFTNVLYLVVWFFLAFYMLKDVPAPWQMLISQVGTAGATYMLSQTMSK